MKCGTAVLLCLALMPVPRAFCEVCNLKVVTDASPDYYDMDSMIHSITSKWPTPAEKCWAMFYWNHIARRQTTPIMLHGLALGDPIRQFNDYGYTMCSTIAGINCSIWDAMGFRVKYWDIANHTVPEVEYDGRWHMYDNSMSALYTLCDGKTIAGVEDIGKAGSCEASGEKVEPGHIARYHCLNATSKNGFLTGADCARDLDQEYRCFNPNALKYRYYYYDWDRGHRYILNLREGEVYTRYYASLGNADEHYVPNNGADPEKVNERYRIRGNGIRTFKPDLTKNWLSKVTESMSGVKAMTPSGVEPTKAGEAGQAVFKVEGANVITGLTIKATFLRKTDADTNSLSVSVTNGLNWKEVWKNNQTGETPVALKIVGEVNGSYEALVKVTLMGQTAPSDAQLKSIEFDMTTMLNSKTQPKLMLGKNTVYVGVGDQTESIVFWPDLQGENWKPYVVDHKNMKSEPHHIGYQGVMHAIKPNEEAYVVFKVDAPRDITRINYGGRLYNRAPKSHIDFLHSFDGGKIWTQSYSLTSTDPPWDVIHYETLEKIPARTRSVLFKYLLNSSEAGTSSCSIYAVRMEVNHKPADTTFKPIEVTFNWSEVQKDYSRVERSHTELVKKVPYQYAINVGGEDHPVVKFLRVNLKGALPDVKPGYSDGKDVGGEKFTPRWVTYGRNFAEGKPYTVSVPSNTNWGAGDPEGKKLTDGVVGPPYAGGGAPTWGLCWDPGTTPEITVDLEQPQTLRAFRIHLTAGWPWWDALKNEVKDQVEALTSPDGKEYTSQGFFKLNLRWKDIPTNHLMPDDETAGGFNFDLVAPAPVQARYVKFRASAARLLVVTEVQALDSIRYDPFDLRIALPDERPKTPPVKPEKTAESAAAPTKASSPSQGRTVASAEASPPSTADADKASKPGEATLEAPTFHSLGLRWMIEGDANKNAKVSLDYRKAGSPKWSAVLPLFRVEGQKCQPPLREGKTLFAGSVFDLQPGTAYELRMKLTDPDGGDAEKDLKCATRAEPAVDPKARTIYCTPGDGGGTGTKTDPFKGLAAAQTGAQPGDIVDLAPGVYQGAFVVDKSGSEGKPVVWRGSPQGKTIIDGGGAERSISANDIKHVYFLNLTIRNGRWGMVAHGCAEVYVNRCHFLKVECGFTAHGRGQKNITITDCLLEGPSTWPRTKGIEDAEGVEVQGDGNVVAYNRIHGFADAISIFHAPSHANDFYNNEISECTDDAIEMDDGGQNNRCFRNRCTNVFQGISFQPVYGGPCYVFRNALYNVEVETFKIHNSPSGFLVFHNSTVKKGMPVVVYTSAAYSNSVFRNNLFVGTVDNYAMEITAPATFCDWDYDGFAGGPFALFAKWNGKRYEKFENFIYESGIERHAVQVDAATAFASGVMPPEDLKKQYGVPLNDLRLKEGSKAIDTGDRLPNINDDLTGNGPDLGAYELGTELPHYGPR